MYVHVIGRVCIGYWCSKHDQKRYYKKTRFGFSTCSYKNTKLYYCHGFSRINSEKSTFFLERKFSLSQYFSLLLCLSPFHPLLYLFKSFCAFFLPVPFITILNCFFYFFNTCCDSLVRQLICTDHLHYYNRLLKMGMIWCQKTHHCLLNPSTPITNKMLVLKYIFMFFPYYIYLYGEFFVNSFNRYYFIK